jgi:hypothetical protein
MIRVQGFAKIDLMLSENCTLEELRAAVRCATSERVSAEGGLTISGPCDVPPGALRVLAELEPATAAAVFAAADAERDSDSGARLAMPVASGSEASLPVSEGCEDLPACANNPRVPPYFKRETWEQALFKAQMNSQPEGAGREAAVLA